MNTFGSCCFGFGEKFRFYKMLKFSRVFLLFTLLLFVYSCGGDELSAPETESDVLNNILQRAPLSQIDLQNSEQLVRIIPDEQIYSIPNTDNGASLPDNATQVKLFGDHLVIMQTGNSNVVVLDMDEELVTVLGGNDGLQKPATLMAGNNNLYIYDDAQKELRVFDSEYSVVDSISFGGAYFTQGSIDMNPAFIIYQPDEATGFRVSDTDRQLLTIAPKSNPDSTAFEAFPRIVPSGKHPGGYNNLSFSINQNNNIAAAYPALPYLFIYNDLQHFHTVLLESERFESFDNPSLSPFEPVMGEPVTVRSLLGQLTITDSGDILLFSLDLLHHIEFIEEDNAYRLKNSYALIRGDTGEQIRSISSLDLSPDAQNRVFATGDGILFEFTLSE